MYSTGNYTQYPVINIMEKNIKKKLRHRCREQTYGHQGGKAVERWGWWCDELGNWDRHVYTDVYKIDD